ncbi:MAG: hypothetical protein KDD45_04255 [Bdellovibrionales bacterium]|nr:hypothetical protein [Bdellovibrionales bacterium]
MKKWIKSDQAILFRLNNKIVQINFNDKSQLMFYTQKDLLLYSSPQGKDKQVLDLNSPEIKKNSEISKRYIYFYLELNMLRLYLENWHIRHPIT